MVDSENSQVTLNVKMIRNMLLIRISASVRGSIVDILCSSGLSVGDVTELGSYSNRLDRFPK